MCDLLGSHACLFHWWVCFARVNGIYSKDLFDIVNHSISISVRDVCVFSSDSIRKRRVENTSMVNPDARGDHSVTKFNILLVLKRSIMRIDKS